jgi:HK97 family phage major capsid protein
MNLADRIKAAEEALVAVKDQLVEATKALEASPDEESLLTQVEELTTKVTKGDASLAALKKAEQALAARATSAPAVVQSQHLQKNSPKQAGDIMFKHATASLLAFIEKKPVAQVVEERYADATYLKAALSLTTKTAVAPAMTDVAGWAEELTREDTMGFIDSLKDVSVGAALAARATRLNFGGAASLKIPRRNPLAASLTEPAWVGEGGVIPLTRFSFGSTTLNRYKLAAITTFTREIAERSTPAIEGLLREALREAYAEVLDGALLSTAAGVPGVRPSGLLYSDFGTPGAIAPIAPTAGGGEDAVRGDIMKLVGAMTAARVGARPVLLVNNLDRLAVSMMTSAMSEYIFRDELASGNLLGIPVIASANVPQHHVVLVDAAYLATAFDAPMFDVSDVATVVEANADGTAPTQAGTAGAHPGAVGTAGQVPKDGGIPVSGGTGNASTGYTTRSLWQTYSLGLRMVSPTTWAMMQPGAVQHSTPTTWTA